MADYPASLNRVRQKLCELKNSLGVQSAREGVDMALSMLEGFPQMDAVEVVHGRWEQCFEDWRHQIEGDKCSACGFEHYGAPIGHYHFCPNCGAKMDGGEEG